jgi:hypothetical protein
LTRRAGPVHERLRDRGRRRGGALGKGRAGTGTRNPPASPTARGTPGSCPPERRAAPGSRTVLGQAARRARRRRTATRPAQGSSAASAAVQEARTAERGAATAPGRRGGAGDRRWQGREWRLVAKEWRLVTWEKKNYTGSGIMLNNETLTLAELGYIFILGIVGPRPIIVGPSRGKP